ncbi:hypothetical protein JZ751_024238 [Albula glossodonta]|uniref:3-oxo-5alpha-steroid 4-dehydrogenase (NADP(+)) n=1 Tax=Albula glossodonta TaxID=121402 RepID=A0A8T2NET2_9TELE|nr:hypothetical protein JZ751_024238 [Albula glossodonta]
MEAGGGIGTWMRFCFRNNEMLLCGDAMVQSSSWGLMAMGVAYLFRQVHCHTPYGRYMPGSADPVRTVPAKLAWFLQELPSFLVPMLLILTSHEPPGLGQTLLSWTFCVHYFQRTFIYSLLTNGRPTPLRIVIFAAIFCSLNGLFQGYYMLYCAKYSESWLSDIRLVTGLTLFFLGMAINIHSDYILRHLRRPGEVVYRIPKGGMFEYVSGANFFGEIVEWFGYAIATWSMPSLSFAIFTMFYLEKFTDYPRSRKAVIPFIF